MTYILTLNCGSSSIKAALFTMPQEHELANLHVSDIGLKHGTWAWQCNGIATHGHEAFPTYEHGLRYVMRTFLRDPRSPLQRDNALRAVAHRVVHGGSHYVDSVRITPTVLAGIRANTKLAPLHTPPNLKGIRVAHRYFPDIPHVAVFDTGFHKSIPDYAAIYPLPHALSKRLLIRRYGFHGISYRYVMSEAARMMRRPVKALRLIACHLGSGCSVCAIAGGKSVDTSMGFTPAEGLMMRTRSGDIDPGILLHLQMAHGFTPDRLNRLLNHQSGFLGVSGGAATMPEVLRRMVDGDPRATLAFEMFCYRVEKYIGAYVATLGGIDGLIFTAGIGENQPEIRAQIVKWCRGFGLTIDGAKNCRTRGTAAAIHARGSQAAILVIPTNEGVMMARDASALV
ncbi:MAG: acetate/propionate family kinase [Deltaproteobacteria bacterium]|nr:acetate/propionate family kinase [Deltaproteobacteria bacterium]